MVFYAHIPIAGGFLAQSRAAAEAGTFKGRFAVDDDRDPMSSMYRAPYLKPARLEGLERWKALALVQWCSQAELAYRWVYYHISLEPMRGNMVILGARRVDQITLAVEGLKQRPLTKEVVGSIEVI